MPCVVMQPGHDVVDINITLMLSRLATRARYPATSPVMQTRFGGLLGLECLEI